MAIITPGTAGLWSAYAIAAAIAISICYRSTWTVGIKALAVVLAFALFVQQYAAIPRLSGWPSEDRLPQNFRLLAATVEEPDKVRGQAGMIYLWTMSLDENPLPKPPRAYRLPYSVQLQDKLNAALTKIRRGLPQMGQSQQDSATLHANPDPAAAPQSLEFFDVPDPLFPES